MKFALEKYPKGSFKRQVSDGKYCDGTLYQNIDVLARNIVDDMTFLVFIYSSTLEVGTGKSVFASQLGELWIDRVNKNHNLDLKFDMNNCVFTPKDLIDRSFKLPKYSVIWLDEWEDAHYWSELGMSLRQFFRKCRQLNLLMICIIPNFFQLPMNYAVSRSVAAIDVQFKGEFQRGFFAFYNFERKKQLYIHGKKTQNYHICKPNFTGRFTNGYCVDEKEYRAKKLKDMIESEEKLRPKTESEIQAELIRKMKEEDPTLKIETLAKAVKKHPATIYRWLSKEEGTSHSQLSPHISNLMSTDELSEINMEKVTDEPEPYKEPEKNDVYNRAVNS